MFWIGLGIGLAIAAGASYFIWSSKAKIVAELEALKSRIGA